MIGADLMRRRSTPHLLAAAILCAALVAIINLTGYVGSGPDDSRYVEAARCWSMNGACLPHDHWTARWPVFAPMALLINLFGLSRATVIAWPFACSVAALYLCGKLTQGMAGRKSGLLAMFLLAATPSFNQLFGTPSVEAFELCMVALAGITTIRWIQSGSAHWAFATGVAFGIGFAARETAIAWALMIATVALVWGFRPTIKGLVAAITGATIAVGGEMLVYWIATGDPFFRLQLSMAHGRIPSTELSTSVDVTRSPILNPDFIGGWRREPGVHVHWLVDGPLNLILNGGAGFGLIMAPLLYLWGRRRVDPNVSRLCAALLIGAIVQIAMINYVFAMDPKPRVFLPAIMTVNIVLAILCVQFWAINITRSPLIACVVMFALSGFVSLFAYIRPAVGQDYAERWIDAHADDVEIDPTTRSALSLARNLNRTAAIGSDKKFVLLYSPVNCQIWLERSKLPTGSLSIAAQKEIVLFTTNKLGGPSICLFRYERTISRVDMIMAGRDNWRARHLHAGQE